MAAPARAGGGWGVMLRLAVWWLDRHGFQGELPRGLRRPRVGGLTRAIWRRSSSLRCGRSTLTAYCAAAGRQLSRRGLGLLLPAGGVVGSLVTDHRVSDPGGAVGHSAGDDPALLAPRLERSCVGPAGRVVESQSHAKIDQGPAERNASLSTDGSVAASSGRLILGRRQSRCPVHLGWPRSSVRDTKGPCIAPSAAPGRRPEPAGRPPPRWWLTRRERP